VRSKHIRLGSHKTTTKVRRGEAGRRGRKAGSEGAHIASLALASLEEGLDLVEHIFGALWDGRRSGTARRAAATLAALAIALAVALAHPSSSSSWSFLVLSLDLLTESL
jgi:hypothetical protein